MFLRPANWRWSRRGATNNKLLVIGIANGGPKPPFKLPRSRSRPLPAKASDRAFTIWIPIRIHWAAGIS